MNRDELAPVTTGKQFDIELLVQLCQQTYERIQGRAESALNLKNRGTGMVNLRHFRQFCRKFPIRQTVSGEFDTTDIRALAQIHQILPRRNSSGK